MLCVEGSSWSFEDTLHVHAPLLQQLHFSPCLCMPQEHVSGTGDAGGPGKRTTGTDSTEAP